MTQGLVGYAIEELRSRGGTSSKRFVDCVVSWRASDGRELMRVGGVWDRRQDGWSPDREPCAARVVQLHPGQDEAGAAFCAWARRYATRDWVGVARPYSSHLYGGRRGGKSWIASAEMVTFALMRPGSTVMCVCPSQVAAEEIHDRLVELLDPDWFTLFEDEARYSLLNGTSIRLIGAGARTSAKQGRIDFACINEAQLCSKKIYDNLRGAVVDAGGLVLLAYNPPDDLERGAWLEELWKRARAREIDATEHFLDNTRNPHIDTEALMSMAKEMDPLTYEREVRGKMGLPPPDAVFYTWADEDHYVPVPEGWLECTGQLTRELLHHEYNEVLGHDFDQRPYLACSRLRAYRHPEEDVTAAHLWVFDAVIERGDEDLIIDRLLERGVEPAEVVLVADASGAWQDVERTKGSTSYDYYKHRGFRVLKPDPKSEKNPLRQERERAMNSRLRSSAGDIRLHVAPPGSVMPGGVVAGEATELVAEAIRRWARKSGKSDARSKYAHICDSVSYPIWRLYGRRLPKAKVPDKGRPRGSSAMRVQVRR